MENNCAQLGAFLLAFAGFCLYNQYIQLTHMFGTALWRHWLLLFLCYVINPFAKSTIQKVKKEFHQRRLCLSYGIVRQNTELKYRFSNILVVHGIHWSQKAITLQRFITNELSERIYSDILTVVVWPTGSIFEKVTFWPPSKPYLRKTGGETRLPRV
jgi:hypothetical protein